MHSQKTRQCQKEENQKEQLVEEDPRKSPEKNKKNEYFEQLNSTISLKTERPQKKSEKKPKYIKTALEIAKNETTKYRKAKEQALAQKGNK